MASAGDLITEFLAERPKGTFLNMDVDNLAVQMFDRVARPGSIKQEETSLCGPSAFFKWLLADRPELYVKYAIDLWKYGRARLGQLDVKPGSDCRKAWNRNAKIAQLDWLTCASLRDSENTFLDYDSPSDEAGGITMPRTLAGWFRAVGYTQVENETNIFITKDMDDLTRAGNLTNNGRRVCLLISADMLSRGTEGGFFTIPDHWIQMTGWGGLRGIGSGKKGAYATVWSWGYWYGLQTLPLKTIESRFFGYVAAVPPGR